MSRRFCRRTLGVAGAGVVRAAWRAAPRCRRRTTSSRAARYESGLEFMSAGKYTEALKDFEAVVDVYPASSVADEALLAIARYQLDVQRNPEAAQSTAESLLKRFPASDSVPMAYVVAGQAVVAQRVHGRQRRCGARQLRTRRAPVSRRGGRRARARGRRRHAAAPRALPGGAREFDAVTLAYPRSSWALAARAVERRVSRGGRPSARRAAAAAARRRGGPVSPEAQQARRWARSSIACTCGPGAVTVWLLRHVDRGCRRAS